MDAEIQFFMCHKDEQEFIEFASTLIDEVKIKDQMIHLTIDDCTLIVTPSLMEKGTLYKGQLEIRASYCDPTNKGYERAKSIFRKLRNWIKKKYWSRLAYIDKNKKDKLIPSRVHWLAPEAKKWKEKNIEGHFLKLSPTSWMVFDIGV